jgi:hypothetical protein
MYERRGLMLRLLLFVVVLGMVLSLMATGLSAVPR